MANALAGPVITPESDAIAREVISDGIMVVALDASEQHSTMLLAATLVGAKDQHRSCLPSAATQTPFQRSMYALMALSISWTYPCNTSTFFNTPANWLFQISPCEVETRPDSRFLDIDCLLSS